MEIIDINIFVLWVKQVGMKQNFCYIEFKHSIIVITVSVHVYVHVCMCMSMYAYIHTGVYMCTEVRKHLESVLSFHRGFQRLYTTGTFI